MTRNLKEFVNHNIDLATCPGFGGDRHVAILLAHYNGNAHLGEQLASLAAQTHRDWSLILSDDGSSDGWLATAEGFAHAHPAHRVSRVEGPRQGSAQNFLRLLVCAGPTVPYAAFCDQDDVWLPWKLEAALAALAQVEPSRPALYCARTMVCDRDLSPLHPSPLFRRPPGFRNALVQSIAGGNTMVLNRVALDLLQDTAQHAKAVVAHDWWAYQIISGAGGRILYDPKPRVLYRQHAKNQIGANNSARARVKRVRQLLQGRFRAWNATNIAALCCARHWLTPDAREVLLWIQDVRTGPLHRRIFALCRSGIYRQSWQGQVALWVATLLRKI
ncbi:MAG: glycosyltransferase [Pseudomonadota bacterium]